jgi:general L-amino acid transport system permease protein
MRRWLRTNLFPDVFNTALTVLVFALVLAYLPPLLRWALLDAHFPPDAVACAASQKSGACWGVIVEKYRFILLGRYPADASWRPVLASLLAIGTLLFAALGWLRGAISAALALLIMPLLCIALMAGGVLGLAVVPSELWGGLPLTLLLTVAGMLGALPLGIVTAYGRRSELPTLRWLLTAYVELVRGIPLVSILFVAAFLFPLFFPSGVSLDMLYRVMIAIVLFAAAYLSETLRGGLQAMPAGQLEAAAALGMSTWQIQRHIVLPQVLKAVAPSLANSAIALFKETSLVTVVSLYELTGSLGLTMSGDPQWRPYFLEAYLFLAAIYWLGCFTLSSWSNRLAGSGRNA